MSKFIVKQITKLDDLKLGDELPESDFSHATKTGKFIQFKYVRDDETKKETVVKPGIYSIQSQGSSLILNQTEFNNDLILEDFSYTKQLKTLVDCFFNKLDVYKKYGIEVPRRAAFIFGPAGSSKSTCIRKTVQEYIKDGKTAALLWATDEHEPHWVKDFIKTFKYEGVEKLIFIMEDLGGVEIANVDVPSDPSLLALLDNNEKIFKIPVYVMTTTNFPEIFASNLANRPGRFDDKIEVPFPSAEERVKLLKFFMKDDVITERALELIKSSKTKEFTPAHIKEAVIRSAIHDKTLERVIEDISTEIETYKTAFSKKGRFGINT